MKTVGKAFDRLEAVLKVISGVLLVGFVILTLVQVIVMAAIASKATTGPHAAGHAVGTLFWKVALGPSVAHIWAIVECFIVKKDGKGPPFKKSFV